MKDHPGLKIMTQLAQICLRMKQAREWAGLSIYQAERLMALRHLANIENANAMLTLPTMLSACAVYGVDPTWMLTGVNPAFDPQPWLEKFAETGIPDDQRDRLLEQLAAIGAAP